MQSDDAEIALLLALAKRLGARYRALTGKPLGVAGEVAELEAARLLGLELCGARTAGYDAWDRRSTPARRVQIKGRTIGAAGRYKGQCPAIKCGDLFEDVLLVLLDARTLDAVEIWRSTEARVAARLRAPGSKSRNLRATMSIRQFKSIAEQVWPVPGETGEVRIRK